MNIKESFTYIFKEKNWGWKIAIPSLYWFVFFLISFCATFTFILLPLLISGGPNSRNNEILPLPFSLVTILLLTLSFIFYFGFFLIFYWYTVEGSEAYFDKRSTRSIFGVSFLEFLKKSFKPIIINLVYMIPFFIITCCAFFFFSFASNSIENSYGYSNANSINGMIFLILCCIGAILFLAYFIYYYVVIEGAIFRMIKFKSFNEAFNFKEILAVAKVNIVEILKLFALDSGYWLIYFAVYFGISFVGIILLIIPILGIILYFLLYLILYLIFTYYYFIVRPHLSAQIYQEMFKNYYEKNSN